MDPEPVDFFRFLCSRVIDLPIFYLFLHFIVVFDDLMLFLFSLLSLWYSIIDLGWIELQKDEVWEDI